MPSLQVLDVIRWRTVKICEREIRGRGYPCTLCKRVCNNFPFALTACNSFPCLDLWERLQIVRSRPTGREYLKRGDFLLSFLKWYVSLNTIASIADDTENRLEARRRIVHQITKGKLDQGVFYYIHLDTFLCDAIQRFVREFGCNPGKVDCMSVLVVFDELRDKEIGIGITKSSLALLQNLNFQVASDAFAFVVDDFSDEAVSSYFKEVQRFESDDDLAHSITFEQFSPFNSLI